MRRRHDRLGPRPSARARAGARPARVRGGELLAAGTALRTLEKIVAARNGARPSGQVRQVEEVVETLAGARGAERGGVRVHSIRLPGLVAHQEVIFGREGQLLTIRHDTTARESFADGVLLVLEKLDSLPAGVTVGLENLL